MEMLNIFFESRFVYYSPEKNRDKDYMTDKIAGSMVDGGIGDISTARDIVARLDLLRQDLQKSSILNDEDQKTWNKKIDAVKEKPTQAEVKKLEEEFRQEQGAIKNMVDQYTNKVISNKEKAFAVDETRGINTMQEYLDWFMNLPAEEKEKALLKLDSEIEERAGLRRELIKLNPELKHEAVKMDRTEMKEKLKELEVCEDNIQKARTLLERDKKYTSNIEAHLEKLRDKTPDEQIKWLETYEEKIAKPRREVVDKFEALPEEFRDSRFYKLRTPDKIKFLEELESKIETGFISEVQKIPDNVWSAETKKYAIKELLQAKKLEDKAMRLKMLPEFVKAEKKLSEKYKKYHEELKDMPDYSPSKWESLKYEEKEETLERMEAEILMKKNFISLLDNKKKNNVISEKTYARMIADYSEATMQERTGYIRDFSALIKPREDLLKNFLSLNAQTREHFKNEFFGRGYKARLEIFKEALAFDAKTAKNHDKKEKAHAEKMPQSIASAELKAIIDNLKLQADLCESEGNFEKALGIHESILQIDPQNTYSAEKTKDLKAQTEALKAADKMPKVPADAASKEEIENLALLEEILKDKENQILKANGSQQAKKQHAHLGDDSFKHRIHAKINEKSGGEKVLGRDGKVKDVYTIDVENFGSDTAEDKKHEIQKKREALGANDNFIESRLADKKTGKVLSFDEARKKLEIRKQKAAQKISGMQKVELSDAEGFIEDRFKKAS